MIPLYKKIKEILKIDDNYNIIAEEQYVNDLAIRWCEVKNGIAYVALEFLPKNIEMGTEGYKFFSGLPHPKQPLQILSNLYRGNQENLLRRFYIKKDGTLNYWYNPSSELKTSYTFIIETSYPVEE